jgi:hypothetical protein
VIRRALLFAALLISITAGVSSADDPTSLGDYGRAVSQALDLVERAAAAPPAERAPLLTQAASALAPIRQVQLENGNRETVDNSDLVAELTAAAQNGEALDRVKNVAARLQALRATLDQAPVAASAAERAKLRDLLARPPFKTDTSPNFLARFLDGMAEWVDRLLNGTVGGIINVRDWVILAGMLLMAGMLVFFVRSILHNLAPEAQLETQAGEALTLGQVLAQAQRFAQSGDYRSAVRDLYLAALLLLDEQGVLRYDRALTNREVLAAVARPEVRAALEPIVQTFDRTWYGFVPIGQEEFETYRRQVDTIREIE